MGLSFSFSAPAEIRARSRSNGMRGVQQPSGRHDTSIEFGRVRLRVLGRQESMSMVRMYGHPFAAFYWKALIAVYERNVPFEFLMIDAEHAENATAIGRLSPTGQFPV